MKTYENVDTIIIKGKELRVGTKLSCLCDYEVVKISPVWHSDTGKHIVEHKNNTFSVTAKISNDCLLHGKIYET